MMMMACYLDPVGTDISDRIFAEERAWGLLARCTSVRPPPASHKYAENFLRMLLLFSRPGGASLKLEKVHESGLAPII